MGSLRRARLSLVAAALLFSTGGAAIKSSSLRPVEVAAGRSLLAFLVLALFLRGPLRRPSWLELVTAACYAVTMILFVFANRMTTAASAVFLQGSAPLFVLLLGPLFLREWPRRRDLQLLAVMGLGLTLFLLSPSAAQLTAPDPSRGNVLAALSGLSWAGTLLGLRALARTGRPALAAVLYGNALVALLLASWIEWPAWSPPDVLLLLWLGVFQVGLAYFFTTRGMSHVPAFEASLLFLLEPAFGPLWAFLVHGERGGALEFVGGALLITAGVAATLRREPSHSRLNLPVR